MEFYGYFASVLMGVSLGMIGGGGSILTVPILVYIFQIDPVLATAYSLFIVGLTALFGGLGYIQKSEVDFKTGFIFAVPSFIGVYLVRSYVVPQLPETILTIGSWILTKNLLVLMTFAVLMLLASVSMIRQKKSDDRKLNLNRNQKILLIAVEGLVVGGITGFVGAGGGFLIIPALVLIVGLPMKKAVGTSLLIIAAKSLIGFTGDLQHQALIDWSFLFKISTFALVGLVVGVYGADRVPEKTLKKGFGIFVLLMGLFILTDQVLKMT